MERHQEDQLKARLEECFLTGQTYLSWAQIYLWWRLDRIAKTPWRDIHGLWTELCVGQGLKKAPDLEVRNADGKGREGGVRLVRKYMADRDGNSVSLSSMAS